MRCSDFANLNIMLDGTPMYPEGFHPTLQDLREEGFHSATYISRSSTTGVRYFITDFGLSTQFKDGETRSVTGIDCQDKEVPELSEDEPYDPFAVDVFTLGNLYRKELIQVCILRSLFMRIQYLTS